MRHDPRASYPLTLADPQRRRLAQAAVALGATVAGWTDALALDKGDTAPALQLPGLNGTISLADWRGKLVYVDFWASWCGPCRKSFPWMNDLQARLGPRGLVVLGVNLDARREDADRFLAANPARFALAFDPQGESARRFGIKGMPSSALVAPDGHLLLQHSGFRDEDRALLEPVITAALPQR